MRGHQSCPASLVGLAMTPPNPAPERAMDPTRHTGGRPWQAEISRGCWLEVRPSHGPAATWGLVRRHLRRGPVRVDLALVPRGRGVEGGEGDHRTGRARRSGPPAARPEAL